MSGITVPTIDEIKGPTVMTKMRNLVSKFITFADEVNDKIDEPLEQAQSAVATANAASATANSASSTANSASATANAASQAAQTAATTVAGYEDRLGDVEDGVAENKANILTHDGEISTINTTLGHIDDDIEQLYAESSNSVKKVTNGSQNVNKGLTVGEVPNVSTALVTKAYVEATDGTNNIVHKLGAEDISGPKRITDSVISKKIHGVWSGGLTANKYRKIGYIDTYNVNVYIDVYESGNAQNFGYGLVQVVNNNPTTSASACKWIIRKTNGTFLLPDVIAIAREVSTGHLVVFAKNSRITGFVTSVKAVKNGSSLNEDNFIKDVGTTDYSLDGTESEFTDIVKGSDLQ